MLENISTLVFDLDGTISDPSLGITRCFNYAFEAHGLNTLAPEVIAAEIGPPLDEAFKKFEPGLDQAAINVLVASYRERYAEVGFAENELYPGIAGMIAQLYRSGRRLGVCTSKRRDFAEKILALFDLSDYFQFVSGGDVGIKKSEQLAELLAQGQIDEGAVMIGDRSVDILAARANRLRSAGVLWGFGSPEEISGAEPTITLTEVDELEKLCL